MIDIAFEVFGEAKPAGSKRAFPIRRRDGSLGVAVTHDNAGTRGWMQLVAATAAGAYAGPLLTGPIRLELTFERPRPKGHFGAKGLRPSAPQWPTTKPDTLKLGRAVEDALRGVIYTDDAQVVEHAMTKRWGPRHCAKVRIVALEYATNEESSDGHGRRLFR